MGNNLFFNNMVLWLAFTIATVASMALMPFLIKYAAHLGMIDAPGARKIHQHATPRCGGIAIAFGTFIAILFLVKDNPFCHALLAGALVIMLFGFLDDIFSIHYKWKFLGQITATIFVISQNIYMHKLPFFGLDDAPLWISYTITALFVIGVTNAVNFADGLDGLAAGIMLLTLAYIVLFSVYAGGMDVAVMALAIGGGLIGFLKYNTFPAIVFMGDVGSQFIGFMAANLSILLTQNVNPALNPALPILILGLPILDTLSVIAQRIRVGLSPFSPDKRHIHHKLIGYGFKHPQAVAIIYILQSIFLVAASLLKYAPDWQVLGFYMALSCCLLGSFYLAGKLHLHLSTIERPIERRGNRFLRSKWIFVFTRKYIELSIIYFLSLLSIAIVYSIHIPFAIELSLMGIAILLYRSLSYNIQDLLTRCSIYMGCMVFAYIQAHLPIDHLLVNDVINIFLILLLLMTCLATRITRKCYFVFNTQDLLVSLFILVALLLIKTEYISRSILYLFCLGYALEYLLQRDVYKFIVIRFLAFLSMLNIILFLWFSN